MLDLTKIDENYQQDILFPDGETITYDCMNLKDDIKKCISKKLNALRDKINGGDAELIKVYGSPIPMTGDPKEDARITFDNIEHVREIIADKYADVEIEAIREVINKPPMSLSMISQIMACINKKVQRIHDASEQKKT